MKRLVPLVLAAALLFPAAAQAEPWRDSLGPVYAPLVRADVQLVRSGCPGREEPACTYPGGPIFLAAGQSRATLLHELGHQFDYYAPEWYREGFVALTSDPRPWRFEGAESPHERSAEAWRLCAQGPRASTFGRPASRRMNGGYGYTPRLSVHRSVCALMRRVGEAMPETFAPGRPLPVRHSWDRRRRATSWRYRR